MITYYTTQDLRTNYSGGFAFGLSKIRKQRREAIEYNKDRMAKAGKTFSAENLQRTFGQHEKEIDWAVVGGAASAVGGIGAGIAGAANAQLENMEIRQRNAERDRKVAQMAALVPEAGSYITGLYEQTIARLMQDEKKDSGLRFGVGKTTRELGGLLHVYVNKIRITDYNSKAGDIEIKVSSSLRGGLIDGYLNLDIPGQGTFVVPMPYCGGEKQEADLTVHAYTGITQEIRPTIRPIVLWTVHRTEEPDTRAAHYATDMSGTPGYQAFMADWNLLEAKKEAVKKKRPVSSQDIGEALAITLGGGAILGMVLGMFIIIASNNKASPGEALLTPVLICTVIFGFFGIKHIINRK